MEEKWIIWTLTLVLIKRQTSIISWETLLNYLRSTVKALFDQRQGGSRDLPTMVLCFCFSVLPLFGRGGHGLLWCHLGNADWSDHSLGGLVVFAREKWEPPNQGLSDFIDQQEKNFVRQVKWDLKFKLAHTRFQ